MFRLSARTTLLTLAALLWCAACKSAPEAKPTSGPELTSQELAVTEQSLTEFKVRLSGKVKAPAGATLLRASYELVVDEKVIKSGEQPLSAQVAPGAEAEFQLEQGAVYVANADELKAMSARGGSLLAALRGKLFLLVEGKTVELPYARSREVRVPRLVRAELKEVDAARFADDEASVTFYLAVDNPNPFPVKLSALQYALTINNKPIAEGRVGSGEKVGGNSHGVFEIQVAVSRDTYGADVAKLIKTLNLPYVLKGELSAELVHEPYELKGNIKLRQSK